MSTFCRIRNYLNILYVLYVKNSSCEWWKLDLQLHFSSSWDYDDWNLRYEQRCLTLPVVFNWKADNLPGCDMIKNCPWKSKKKVRMDQGDKFPSDVRSELHKKVMDRTIYHPSQQFSNSFCFLIICQKLQQIWKKAQATQKMSGILKKLRKRKKIMFTRQHLWSSK